jgi:hypothetical protein
MRVRPFGRRLVANAQQKGSRRKSPAALRGRFFLVTAKRTIPQKTCYFPDRGTIRLTCFFSPEPASDAITRHLSISSETFLKSCAK